MTTQNQFYTITYSKRKPYQVISDKTKKIPAFADRLTKVLFLREDKKLYTAWLLAHFLKKEPEIIVKQLKFYKNEIGKESELHPGLRCDIAAIYNKTLFQIEFNSLGLDYVVLRNLQYALHDIMQQKELENVVLININNYAYRNDDKVMEKYLWQSDEKKILTRKVKTFDIYLPNLERKYYNVGKEGLNRYERFLLAGYVTDYEGAQKIAKGDKLMEQFVKDNYLASFDKLPFQEITREQEMVYASYLQGKEHGIEEGEKQGQEQEKYEVAKNLQGLGFTIDMISQVTGLSKEKILSL